MSNFEKCNGCFYYYGEIDNCMYGEDDVVNNMTQKCKDGKVENFRKEIIHEDHKE